MRILIAQLMTAFVILGLTSCSISRKKEETIKTNEFSNLQSKLIHSGNVDEPMRVFLITNHKDSILLRQNCDSVFFRTDSASLKHFSQRLYRTVTDSSSLGVGIAAPQVGILKRIIWVQRFDKTGFPFEVYINPTILKYTEKKQDCPEGCLSIPNKQATTKNRSYAILLKYQSLDGEEHTEMIESFTAVIFQHEIDHLNGILFIDHLKEELDAAKVR